MDLNTVWEGTANTHTSQEGTAGSIGNWCACGFLWIEVTDRVNG